MRSNGFALCFLASALCNCSSNGKNSCQESSRLNRCGWLELVFRSPEKSSGVGRRGANLSIYPRAALVWEEAFPGSAGDDLEGFISELTPDYLAPTLCHG
jgi:hypothetical protein